MKKVLAIALLTLVLMPFATLALAQDHGTTVASETAQQPVQSSKDIVIWKALGAALAIGFAAFATAWAQSKIGAAAAGAIAEKPEVGGLMIILEALPETIIILGFVIAIMIVGIK